MRDYIFKTKGPLDPARDEDVLMERREMWQLLRLATQPMVYSYVALLSPRQMGKTTTLYKVRAMLERQDCGVALVDLSPLEGRDEQPESGEADCYRFVCRQILADLAGQMRLPRATREKLEAVDDPTRFHDFLLEVAQRARPPRLVIMLDEVRAVPAAFASAFFGTIRSIFTSRRKESEQALEKYLFVFSGAAELYELTSGKNSPLNICETIYLRDLDTHAVRMLVAKLERIGARVPPAAADYIYAQTKGHPYLTQRLCSILELHQVPEVTQEAVDEAVAELLRGDDNIDHITRQLDAEPAARMLARKLAVAAKEGRHADIPFSRANHDVSRLEMIGVVAEDVNLSIRNPIYQRALERYFDLGDGHPGPLSRLQRAAFPLLLGILLLLTLPNLVLYTNEVLLSERFVNQPIMLPALQVSGYVRHHTLIGVGKEQTITVEIVRPASQDVAPVRAAIEPLESDLTSADGNYTLLYEGTHESKSFVVALRKSGRLQDFVFPYLTQRQRHVNLYILSAAETNTLANAAPAYTVTMKVDYFSAFLGSVVVWLVSIFAGVGSLLSHLDTVSGWLSSLVGSARERREGRD